MTDRISETKILRDRAVILVEQRDAWRAVALKLARHVRISGEIMAEKQFHGVIGLLDEVRALDPELYEKEVVR